MARLAAHGDIRALLPSGGAENRGQLQWRVWRGFPESPTGLERKSRAIGWSEKLCSLGNKSSSSSNLVAEDEWWSDEAGDSGDGDCDVDDFGDEFSCFRALVLDISYRPINVVCWKRAICLEFTEKAHVLEYYDQPISSAQGSLYIPAVLRVPHLLQVMKRRRIKYNLNRKNLYFRDSYTCQYCSSHENLTIDHILPMSRGGEWKWENLVTACTKCNSRKGDKTMEEASMTLIKTPKAPKDYDILAIPFTSAALRSLKMSKGVPEEWRQYLSKS